MVDQETVARIRDRLRDQYGSRIWFWSSFILVAASLAVDSRQDPGGDLAVCRDWFQCLVVVTGMAVLLSGSALAFSLLFLAWWKRTRPWVYAGGFIITLFFLMTIAYIRSRG